MKNVKISWGNSKMGKVANTSLRPIKDCINCRSCKKDCYALKAYKMYPAVKNAWNHNSDMFRGYLNEAAKSVTEQLQKKRKKPSFFRIHVAGDFLSQAHFNAWCVIARDNPETKFLAFTKTSFKGDVPDNMTIIRSQWPGHEIVGEEHEPKAWMQDGSETRIPESAFVCHGSCETCGVCWNMGRKGFPLNVVFEKH